MDRKPSKSSERKQITTSTDQNLGHSLLRAWRLTEQPPSRSANRGNDGQSRFVRRRLVHDVAGFLFLSTRLHSVTRSDPRRGAPGKACPRRASREDYACPHEVPRPQQPSESFAGKAEHPRLARSSFL